MAGSEIISVSARKAQLINRSNALREELHRCARDLRTPVEALQTGIDFALAGKDWLHMTAPYRHAKRNRKWLAVPRVLTRFLHWQIAD